MDFFLFALGPLASGVSTVATSSTATTVGSLAAAGVTKVSVDVLRSQRQSA